MMRQMRENTKWIMLITAAAFVGLMVFQWGMDASGRSSQQYSGGQIGSVNGQPVTYDEFSPIYQNLYNQQQAKQKTEISPSENRKLEDQAWQELVSQQLIQDEIQKRGITVTNAEIKEAAKYSPPPEFYNNKMFQTDGKFDLNKYHQFLASPAANDQLLIQLEQYYRQAIPRAKLFRQVVAGTYVSTGQLWRMYRDRNERVEIRYVVADPDQVVADSAVTVTEQEVRQYYQAHMAELTHPAQATIKVVSINKAPLPSDTAAALKRAEALRQQIVGGASFAALAKKESADTVSAENGGELTIKKGQTVAPFDSAAFRLPIGRISRPVLTSFGYHIIQVESRKGDEAKVRHILIPIKRTNASMTALLTRADSLESLGASKGLEAAAKVFNLDVRQLSLSQTTPFLPGVGSVADGVDWIFGDAQPGETSAVFENPDNFYMVELVSSKPAGIFPYNEIHDQLRTRVMEEKKMRKARQIARQIVDEARGKLTLQQAARQFGLPVATAGPFSRMDYVPVLGSVSPAIGAAFGLQPGETSPVIESDGRLFIEQLVRRIPADHATFQKQEKQMRGQVTTALEQSRLNLFLQDLHDNATIVDNRSKVLNNQSASGAAQ